MPYILTLLLIVIATEAITEILVKSELFEPLRKYLFSRSVDSKVFKFFHDLLDCGYCTSVWIAFFLFIFFMFIPEIMFFVCLVFVIHRLSNVWHFIIDRLHGLDRT